MKLTTSLSPAVLRMTAQTASSFKSVPRQVVLGGGAKWIWNIADELFRDAIQIVDRFHAKQHLSDVSKDIFGAVSRIGQLAGIGRRGRARKAPRTSTLEADRSAGEGSGRVQHMNLLRHPFLVFPIAAAVLWGSAMVGARFGRRGRSLNEDEKKDVDLVVAATMTLLGLIIGFSFSMAINRYDLRKNLEEEEANAIGTEYLRVELLPANDAARLRELLRNYLDQRIQFYGNLEERRHLEVNAATTQLQAEMWSVARISALAQPTPLSALVVSGMNDVLNSQGYAQAAWWNRIPVPAWGLMAAIAVYCNFLIGMNVRKPQAKPLFFLILPVVVGIAFMLIADIDSPRGGIIRVRPQNLVTLSHSLGGR